jgi:hypothetical protein
MTTLTVNWRYAAIQQEVFHNFKGADLLKPDNTLKRSSDLTP